MIGLKFITLEYGTDHIQMKKLFSSLLINYLYFKQDSTHYRFLGAIIKIRRNSYSIHRLKTTAALVGKVSGAVKEGSRIELNIISMF